MPGCEAMSMSHKAFVFDWNGFQSELAPLLARSLADGDTVRLIEFGSRHQISLREPYEGEPLDPDWIEHLEIGDVQEVADFVLTRYYDPTQDRGLGGLWSVLDDSLDAGQRQALLGRTVGPETEPFDPGRMGSYFQDEETARKSLDVLRQLTRPEVANFVSLLEQAVTSSKGLYVTF